MHCSDPEKRLLDLSDQTAWTDHADCILYNLRSDLISHIGYGPNLELIYTDSLFLQSLHSSGYYTCRFHGTLWSYTYNGLSLIHI